MTDHIRDPLRLTRRDRAALVLAYEEVRGGSLRSAIEALKHHDGGDWPPYLPPVIVDAEAASDDAIPHPPASRAWYAAHYRFHDVLRARLALALRAILRADAGDYGVRSECVLCYGTTCGANDANCISDGGCCPCHGALTNGRITPLWEQAPATGER